MLGPSANNPVTTLPSASGCRGPFPVASVGLEGLEHWRERANADDGVRSQLDLDVRDAEVGIEHRGSMPRSSMAITLAPGARTAISMRRIRALPRRCSDRPRAMLSPRGTYTIAPVRGPHPWSRQHDATARARKEAR